MSKAHPDIQYEIGDRIGLWEVLGPPSKNRWGKISLTSKYQCKCHGCNGEFYVRRRWLVTGRSNGCKKCRTVNARLNPDNRKLPNPLNPKCETCGITMSLKGRRTRADKKQVGDFRCWKCQHKKTSVLPKKLIESLDLAKNKIEKRKK